MPASGGGSQQTSPDGSAAVGSGARSWAMRSVIPRVGPYRWVHGEYRHGAITSVPRLRARRHLSRGERTRAQGHRRPSSVRGDSHQRVVTADPILPIEAVRWLLRFQVAVEAGDDAAACVQRRVFFPRESHHHQDGGRTRPPRSWSLRNACPASGHSSTSDPHRLSAGRGRDSAAGAVRELQTSCGSLPRRQGRCPAPTRRGTLEAGSGPLPEAPTSLVTSPTRSAPTSPRSHPLDDP